MQQIPNWYWMIILAGLSGLLGLIFFYFAMLLKESMLAVREIRYMVIEVHDIIDSVKMIVDKVQRIVDMVGNTVETFTTNILKPLAAFGAVFSGIKGFVSKFTPAQRADQEAEVEAYEELSDDLDVDAEL
jgi:predicted RNA-binding protein with EMAP domain